MPGPSRQGRSVALTLLSLALVALALVNVASAHGPDHAQKRHAGKHDRMLKNRQLGILSPGTVGGEAPPPSGNDGAANAGANPNSLTDTSSGTGTAASSAATAVTGKSAASSSSASSTASGNALSSILSSVLNPSSSSSSSSTTTTSLSSSTTTSSSSSSTTTSSSSSTTSITATSSSSQPAAIVTEQPTPSTMDVTQVVTAPTSSANNNTLTTTSNAAKTSNAITKDTITAIVAVAASIGAIILIWTGIRKWKFRPSKDFNDRMQAIDWEPTSHDGAESGVPGHRRVASVASSFRSGENATGYGGSRHGHNSLSPLPEHDFTAGPTPTGAPVGTYADLARGPSPHPSEMVQRGGSLSRGPYEGYGANY